MDTGESFGEWALLKKPCPRSSTIQCRTPVHWASLDFESYDAILAEHDQKRLEGYVAIISK